MRIVDLIKPQYVDVKVDGFELRFKKLNWNELKTFQEFATEANKKELDETESSQIVSRYLFQNYILDESDDVISDEHFACLPTTFCMKVAEKFMEISHGTAEVKKN